jgi:3-oxoacyl-[acyl-carrier protein] reductase
MLRMKNTAIVTGAAGGMGLAVAAQLARDGMRVYAIDVQPDLLEEECKRLSGEGLDVRPIVIDISSEEAVTSLPQKLGEDFAQLRVLVNNAAISPKRQNRRVPVTELSFADWQKVIDVNLSGAFLMCRTCLQPMMKAGFGRIINNSSVGGKTVIGIAAASYNASKAGILGMTRAMALEVAPLGVTVNAICPGRVETPMAAGATKEANAALLARTPVGFFGQPQDVADLVSFLASERSRFITGASIDINGGMAML